LRQLLLLAEGHSRALWAHTSSVIAAVANSVRNPDRQSKPFTPDQFNPHTPQKARGEVVEVTANTIEVMRQKFLQ